MNNKRLGTEFEREMCEILREDGYWVHFMSPDNTGAQPFDIIAVKNGYAIASDCKTSESPIFRMNRLEWNQVSAFDYWIKCNNGNPVIWVKYKGDIYLVMYLQLKMLGKVDLRRFEPWYRGGKHDEGNVEQ